MYKFYLSLILSLISLFTFGQEVLVDKIANSICKCLTENKGMKDSALLKFCFLNAASEVEGLPKGKSKTESLFTKAAYRLGVTCSEYVDIANRLQPDKGDWIMIDSNLISNLDSLECRKIFEYEKLYYLESTGDTTFVSVKDEFWKDSFKGGKYYSLCKFQWASYCDFEIEFIKSNDPTRTKLAFPGDKYYYRIIDKTEQYYLLTFHYKNIFMKFKIYFQ